MIYLDNAATTFPKPETVYQNVDYIMRNMSVNAGRGSYSSSRNAMYIIDQVRSKMAKLVGGSKFENVVFTSSATVALNEIIFGFEWDQFKTVYITPFEHNAVARPLHIIKEKFGCKLIVLPFNQDTLELECDETKRMFANDPPDYIFINHVSNVTGSIQPVKKITDLAKEFKPTVILDASQSLGLLPISIDKLGIDFLVFAGHKNLYAPFGIGGFIQNGRVKLNVVFAGGTGSDSLNLKMPLDSPNAYEYASPNIIAISGLNVALDWLESVGIKNILDHEENLSRYLISELSKIKNIKLYVPKDLTQHTSVVSFSHSEYSSTDVGTILDHDYDIAVRTGYHCAPYVHNLICSLEKEGTVRASVSYFNTFEDIKKLVSTINEL